MRSSAMADVTPVSGPRSKVSSEVQPMLGLPADPRSKVQVRPMLASPTKSYSVAVACPPVSQPAVAVLARHIRQSIKYWSSKSAAVDAVTGMMTSQPCCSDVVDAILQVLMLTERKVLLNRLKAKNEPKTKLNRLSDGKKEITH